MVHVARALRSSVMEAGDARGRVARTTQVQASEVEQQADHRLVLEEHS